MMKTTQHITILFTFVLALAYNVAHAERASITFTYDELNRITTAEYYLADGHIINVQYNLDALGNIVSENIQKILPKMDGDINGNMEIGLEDVILALQVASGQSPNPVYLEREVTGDGRINVDDGLYAMLFAAGEAVKPFYYEIYGAFAGDYTLTTEGHTLLGTSDGGTTFDVSAFDRFLIHIPASADRIMIDAIGLDSNWVNSAPGQEYAHWPDNIDPTNGTWDMNDYYIEGPPDGYTIENSTLGSDAYYSFSTMGAQSLKIYSVAGTPTNIPLLSDIPSASITLDGSDSDWTGITPVITDQQGDSVCKDSSRDIKSLSLAKDDSNIYWKVETWSGTYPASGFIVSFLSSDRSTEVKNGVHGDSYVNFNERFGNNDYEFLFSGGSGYVRIGEIAEGRFPLSMFAGHSIEKVEAIYADWAVSGTGCDYTEFFQ